MIIIIAYIILHYKNYHDTLECLESIKNTKGDKKIVIVLNSEENSDIINKFKKYTNDIIDYTDNLGFAKGNNKGCSYAIDKYQPDFLAVLNNDIIIEQNNFGEIIKKTYQEYKFDVLGPKILPEHTESVNPFPAYKNIEEVSQAINKSKKLIKIYSSLILRNALKVYLKTKYLLKKPIKNENGQKLEENVALHGCALIFSKKYYQKYANVFYNETFMFHEEEFLLYRMNRDKLTFIYDPRLEVFHKEGASLDNNFKTNYEKLIFKNKYIIESLEKLEKIMESNKKI